MVSMATIHAALLIPSVEEDGPCGACPEIAVDEVTQLELTVLSKLEMIKRCLMPVHCTVACSWTFGARESTNTSQPSYHGLIFRPKGALRTLRTVLNNTGTSYVQVSECNNG